jgi:hypothetical protein
MMSDAYMLKETVEFFIFTSLVSLHGNNFLIKLALNIFLEVKKNLKNLRTLFEDIDPGELAKIINETACLPTERIVYRT